MKKLLALALVVFGLAACQTEPEGFDVTVNGEVPVTVTVDLADAVGTRADSAEGAIDNAVVTSDDYTLRYALQVFNENGTASKDIKYKYSDNTSVAFDLRLVPNRNYKFVVWADIVDAHQTLTEDVKCADLHYAIVDDLRNITLNNSIIAWKAMDETRDAYTGVYDANNFNAAQNITIKLTRPFAKLRVVTTDIAELFDGVVPAQAVATYTTKHRTSFDAFAKTAGEATLQGVQHTFDIAGYTEGDDADTENNKTLFVDYFFAADQDDVVNFTLDVKEANGTTIKKNTFNTPIPVKRNFLTTIKGNVLTEGNKISIDIDDNFGENQENQENWGTISSQAELNAAVAAGGLYKVINLITLTNSGASTTAVRFAATPAPVETIIDLNGYTITGKNTGNTALITVADGNTLTFTGDGNVVLSSDSTAALIDNNGTVNIEGGTFENENTTGNVSLIDNTEGTTNVNGGEIATDNVIEGGETQTTAELLAALFVNGGELTLGENVEISAPLTTTTSNKIVLDGNGKSITYTGADRAIQITQGNVEIKNLTINMPENTPEGSRGINLYNGVTNAAIDVTLNNVTVNGYKAYAVNIGGGSNNKLTIKNSTLTGYAAINVNVASENHTIVVDGCVLNGKNHNNNYHFGTVVIDGTNKHSLAITNSNITTENLEGVTSKYYQVIVGANCTYECDNNIYVAVRDVFNETDGLYYIGLEGAIKDGAKLIILKDIELAKMITIPAGADIVLNLNGKTITGTDTTSKNFSIIDNRGTLLVKNGTMTLTAIVNSGWNRYSAVLANNPGGNLTVEDVTIEHLGGTDMAYGIDNLTNGKGTRAVTNINDGAVVKSPYRAVRQFLNGVEAFNELYINAGAKIVGANKSVWLQDPGKGANSGKIVVKEGAELYGDVYLSVTAGSTEWPVEVSIAASAVKDGEVLTSNVPEGYGLINENGVWKIVKDGVNNYILISTAERLVELGNIGIKPNGKVYMIADIDLTGKEFKGLQFDGTNWAARRLFDGQGYTVSNWTYNDGASDMGFIRQWVGEVRNINFDNCHLKTGGRSAIAAGKIYGNIDNIHISNSSIEDSYWACGAVAGLYNAGNIANCTVTTTTVKSNGGVGGIVGVINEEGGTRAVRDCTVSNSTIHHTDVYDGTVYTGGGIVGMFNADANFEVTNCEVVDCELIGKYIYEICPEQ